MDEQQRYSENVQETIQPSEAPPAVTQSTPSTSIPIPSEPTVPPHQEIRSKYRDQSKPVEPPQRTPSVSENQMLGGLKYPTVNPSRFRDVSRQKLTSPQIVHSSSQGEPSGQSSSSQGEPVPSSEQGASAPPSPPPLPPPPPIDLSPATKKSHPVLAGMMEDIVNDPDTWTQVYADHLILALFPLQRE